MFCNDSVIFQISASVYWGFQVKIKKSKVKELADKSTDDLIKYIKNDMKTFFKNHNLLELSEGIDKLRLHFHEDICVLNKDIIYVCDHC